MVAALIIARFIAGELARGWGIVIVVLSALFGLLALLDEVDSITARYTFVDALRYVIYTTPQRILELSPVIAALGTVVAFAQLSRNSELVIIRTAGISVNDVLRLCAFPTVVLMLTIGVAGEWVVADLHQQAETRKAVLRSGNLNLLKEGGLWASADKRYFNVGNLKLGRIPQAISVFEFDEDGALSRVIMADEAELVGKRRWRLLNATVKKWQAGKVSTQLTPSLELDEFWSENELPTLGRSLAAMAPSTLYEYAAYLEATGQPPAGVSLALWQRLSAPFAATAMVLLSAVLGLRFGSTRNAEFGLRVFAATVIAVGFYLMSQIVHTSGQLLGLSAAMTVCIPLAVITTCGVLLTFRNARLG